MLVMAWVTCCTFRKDRQQRRVDREERRRGREERMGGEGRQGEKRRWRDSKLVELKGIPPCPTGYVSLLQKVAV